MTLGIIADSFRAGTCQMVDKKGRRMSLTIATTRTICSGLKRLLDSHLLTRPSISSLESSDFAPSGPHERLIANGRASALEVGREFTS